MKKIHIEVPLLLEANTNLQQFKQMLNSRHILINNLRPCDFSGTGRERIQALIDALTKSLDINHVHEQTAKDNFTEIIPVYKESLFGEMTEFRRLANIVSEVTYEAKDAADSWARAVDTVLVKTKAAAEASNLNRVETEFVAWVEAELEVANNAKLTAKATFLAATENVDKLTEWAETQYPDYF